MNFHSIDDFVIDAMRDGVRPQIMVVPSGQDSYLGIYFSEAHSKTFLGIGHSPTEACNDAFRRTKLA
jgi:hypothetical protein